MIAYLNGGPLNGQRVNIPDEFWMYRLAVPLPLPLLTRFDTEEPMLYRQPIAIYRRDIISTPQGVQWFFVEVEGEHGQTGKT